jgi:alpha-galactosidase
VTRTPRIVIVGAGGYVFPLRLVIDILSFPVLREAEIVMYDIDDVRVERVAARAREIAEQHDVPVAISRASELRRALEGADYVVVAFAVGGPEAARLDVEIPRRYGVDQTFGDTVGPGGVFRALRTAPVLRRLLQDLQEVAPGALVIQYANPMAINCSVARAFGGNVVGLCHSIQNTFEKLVRIGGLDPAETSFRAAGVNHIAWFTDFRRGGLDVYPQIRRAVLERYPRPALLAPDGTLNPAVGGWQPLDERPKDDDLVRAEILRFFGYFHSESSHHASEYYPWFRKTPEVIDAYIPRRNDYVEHLLQNRDAEAVEQRMREIGKDGLRRSVEWCAPLIAAHQGGPATVIYGNVANELPGGRRAIENLPADATVEVACDVDADGVRARPFGSLPAQCAALSMLSVNVQTLAVKAILERDRTAVTHAVALDPYTASRLTLPEIEHMVTALFDAHAEWLSDSAPEHSAA